MADEQLPALQPMSVRAPTDSCLSAKSANGSFKTTHEQRIHEKANRHRDSGRNIWRLYFVAGQPTRARGGRSPGIVRRQRRHPSDLR